MTSEDPTLPAGVTRQQTDLPADDAVGVTLPVGFRAMSDDDGFKLVVKTRPKWAWPLGFFAVFWNGFLVMWFSIAFSTGQWAMAGGGSLHAAIGVVIAYISLRGILNRTEVAVSRGVLKVRHRPLPWFSPPTFTRGDIEQLFVTEDHNLKLNGRPVVRYALELRDARGKEHRLFFVEHPEQVQYLEREIERAFDVVDGPMADELPKA